MLGYAASLSLVASSDQTPATLGRSGMQKNKHYWSRRACPTFGVVVGVDVEGVSSVVTIERQVAVEKSRKNESAETQSETENLQAGRS